MADCVLARLNPIMLMSMHMFPFRFGLGHTLKTIVVCVCSGGNRMLIVFKVIGVNVYFRFAYLFERIWEAEHSPVV